MSPAKEKFTAQEKAAILREHLIEGVPVSKICQKYGMSPSTVYDWRNKLFDEAPLKFGAEKTEAPVPYEYIDPGEPYTDWADVCATTIIITHRRQLYLPIFSDDLNTSSRLESWGGGSETPPPFTTHFFTLFDYPA